MTIRENGDDCSTVGIVLYQTQIKIHFAIPEVSFKMDALSSVSDWLTLY